MKRMKSNNLELKTQTEKYNSGKLKRVAPQKETTLNISLQHFNDFTEFYILPL